MTFQRVQMLGVPARSHFNFCVSVGEEEPCPPLGIPQQETMGAEGEGCPNPQFLGRNVPLLTPDTWVYLRHLEP